MFREQAGSHAIAGEVTLGMIIASCANRPVQNILELGAGIGTLSYALLEHTDAHLDLYEVNDFCIEAIGKNLQPFAGRYTLLTDYNYLPPARNYDLVVIDGGKGKKEGGFPRLVAAYLMSLSDVKTVIVEGQRKVQKYWALKALHEEYICKIKVQKDPTGGKKIGVRIDCRRSRNRWLRDIYFWYALARVC